MSKIFDPLLESEARGQFEGGSGDEPTLKGGWTTKKLKTISSLDNQHNDHGGRESLRLIVEEFGGIDNLMAGLESSELGVKPDSVAKRRQIHGTNSFPPPKIKGLCELIMENFHDPINVVLCVAALVSIVIGVIKEGMPEGLTEGLSIMIALVIIFVVNSANNYASERQLAKMVKACDDKKIKVWRGSKDPVMIGKYRVHFQKV